MTIEELVQAAFADGVIKGIQAAQAEAEVISTLARTTDLKEVFHDFAVSRDPGSRSLTHLLDQFVQGNHEIPLPEQLLIDLAAFTKKAQKS